MNRKDKEFIDYISKITFRNDTPNESKKIYMRTINDYGESILKYTRRDPRRIINVNGLRKNNFNQYAKETRRVRKEILDDIIERNLTTNKKLIGIQKTIMENVKKISPNELLVMRIPRRDGFDDMILNNKNLKSIMTNIEELILNEDEGTVSDQDLSTYINSDYELDDIIFRKYDIYKKSTSGMYFEFYNQSNIDLSELQIYTYEQYDKFLSLSDIQYSVSNIEKAEDTIEHCLVHSLKRLKVDDDKIARIMSTVSVSKLTGQSSLTFDENHINKRDLTKIANICEKNIKLYDMKNELSVDKNGKTERDDKYNIYPAPKNGVKKYKETLELVLFRNHYMPFIKLNVCKFSIDNHDKFKNHKNFPFVAKSNGTKNAARNGVNTKDVLRSLNNQGFFNKRIEEHVFNKSNLNNTKINKFENIGNSVQLPFKDKKKKAKGKSDLSQIWACDCETIYPDNEKSNLEAFFINGVNFENEKNISTATNIKSFLTDIIEKTKDVPRKKKTMKSIKLIFHNCKFDYSVLFKNLNKIEEIIKNNSLYQAKIIFEGVLFSIVDSYHHIAIKLDSFSEVFNTKNKKKSGYMPYSIYRKKVLSVQKLKYGIVNNEIIKINTPNISLKILEQNKNEPYIPEKHYDIIKPYLVKSKTGKTTTFRHMDFMIDYAMDDIYTLREGFLIYRESIMNLTKNVFEHFKIHNNSEATIEKSEGLDVFNYLTISSLSFDLYCQVGCYDKTCYNNGIDRVYIQEALKGGRTQTSRNEMYHIKKDSMYIDGVSLYPSSGFRHNSEYGGIPCGKYQKFESKETFEKIKNKVYYVATINVKSLNDRQQMCFFDYKNEDGKRIYDANYENFIKNNKSNQIIIDRTQLEDYVKYHDMEYEFVQGIYWNEFDPTYGILTEHIFNERKKFKALRNDFGNAMQQVCKLILNSSYGKLGQKPAENKIVIRKNISKKLIDKNKKIWKTTKPAENFLIKNYNSIKYMVQEEETTKFIIKKSEFDHMNLNHIACSILSMSKRIMNEPLDLCNEMGIKVYYGDTDSFMIDLENSDKLFEAFEKKYGRVLKGKNLGQFHNDMEHTFIVDGKKITKDMRGVESYVLAKKSYISRMKLLNKDDSYDDSELYHIRMKGAGSTVIKANLKQLGMKNPLELYKFWYEKKMCELDLCLSSCKFDIKNMNSVYKKKSFYRNFFFGNKHEKQIELEKINKKNDNERKLLNELYNLF